MEKILEKARKFKYTSFNYIDEEDLFGAKVESDSEEYICLFKENNNRIQLYWASVNEEELIKGVKETLIELKKRNMNKFFIEFIPEELVEKLESMGFKVVSEWVDYWKDDLSLEGIRLKNSYTVRKILEHECSEVIKIPKACVGYSREFQVGLINDEFINEWVKEKDSTILVAEIEGFIVGCIMLNIYGHESEKGPIMWLREVAVKPEYHSKGICQALMYKGIVWGQKQGAKRSFLAVDVENYNAISAYEKFGYRRKEERGQINMEISK